MGIPYSWYTQNYTPTSFDESGHGIYQPMTEDEWNRLPENYQRQQVSDNPQGGNGFYDQSLAQRFEAAVGPRPAGYNRGMSAVREGTQNQGFVDPSKVWTDPTSGMRFTWDENYTPDAQNRDRGLFGERPWLTGIGTVLGAGALNNYFMGANALGGGMDAIQAGENVGSALSGGGPTPPSSYWNQIASNGSTDGLFGNPDIYSSAEYWTGDPTGATFMNGAPANVAVYPGTGGLGLQLHNLTGGLTGLFNGAGLEETLGSLGSSLGSLGSTAGSSLLSAITSNPLGLLGAVQAGRSLLGGGSKPSGSQGGDKGGDGSQFAPKAASRGEFTPNPYTQAQIQNYQPVGRY